MKLSPVYLKKNEERRLVAGHLWIYNNEVDVDRTPLKNFDRGELVSIYTCRKQPLGIGYINPHTLLCARLLTHNPLEKIDKEFFVTRIRQALKWREQYFAAPFYRLVFGESDGLSGLIVDRFANVLVVQINTAGMENLKNLICDALVEVLNPEAILWRNDSSVREVEGLGRYVEAAYGAVMPRYVTLEEHGVSFAVPLWDGQKTGWFFDQSYNRKRLRDYVSNISNSTSAVLRILDVCSYIGAWGIQAAVAAKTSAKADADVQVTCIDSSELALSWIKHNAALNQVEDRIEVICDDVFTALKKLIKQDKFFDVIILDPPAFIKKRKDIREGQNAYLRLHELALKLLRGGGQKVLFTTSCSLHMSRDMLLDVIRQAALRVHGLNKIKVVEQLHQAQDHPIHPAIPETDYLKGFVAAFLHDTLVEH